MQFTEEQLGELHQAVIDFRRGMEIRSSLNLRVARRVTSILRIGMISMGAITLLLLVMLIAFNMKVMEMGAVLATMTQKFSSMSSDMGRIEMTLQGMDRDVASLPEIVALTSRMQGIVQGLDGNMRVMSDQTGKLHGNLNGITANVNHMTHTFRGLDGSVQHLGVDINTMSGPSRTFNNMMPFLP